MSDLLQASDATLRIADAALRTNGGRCVLLRLPSPAVSGDDSEQLGLATPQFQDVPVEPATFRKTEGATSVLLVSASAIKALVTTLAFNSVEVLFATAAGVVIDAVLYNIVAFNTSQATGEPFCYSLNLRAPRE